MPTDMMVLMDRDAPRRMMAAFRIFLDVNFSGAFIQSGWKKLLMMVPVNRAMMEAPSRSPGTRRSRATAKAATEKQMMSPKAKDRRLFVCRFIMASCIFS